jgi:hypothetical protein
MNYHRRRRLQSILTNMTLLSLTTYRHYSVHVPIFPDASGSKIIDDCIDLPPPTNAVPCNQRSTLHRLLLSVNSVGRRRIYGLFPRRIWRKVYGDRFYFDVAARFPRLPDHALLYNSVSAYNPNLVKIGG